jgi:hypothetical protein
MLTDEEAWRREQFFDEVCDELTRRGVQFRDQRAKLSDAEAETLYGDDVFQFVIDHWPPKGTVAQMADDLLAAGKYRNN